MDRMTRISSPVLYAEGPAVLVAYEVSKAAGDPRRRFHVTVRGDVYGPDLVMFTGTMDDLHELLLGLHNVLGDAAESPDGRAERVVLRPTEAVDALDGYGLAEGPSVD
jgi:hypothetical protein